MIEAEAEQEKDLKLKTRSDNLSDEEGQILQDEKFPKNGKPTETKADKTTNIRHYADELSKSRFLHWFIIIEFIGIYHLLIESFLSEL